MSEEEEEKLLVFLESRGFKRDQMEGQVKAQGHTGSLNFVLKYKEAFGEEIMFFDLHFEWDYQFKAHRLITYEATHRKEVPIRHTVINGIDTKLVETRMAIENWDAYFEGDHSRLNEHDKAYIKETLDMLYTLDKDQNFEGMHIKESLMFKYWPFESYNHPSKSEFRMVYEKSHEFAPNIFGTGNVNLAYYIVTDKLNELHFNLDSIGIEKLFKMDLYSYLELRLSHRPTSFDIVAQKNNNYGYVEFRLPIVNRNNNLESDSYVLTITPHTEINHVVHNGVDVEQLETLMRSIDWTNHDMIYSIDEKLSPDLIYTPEMTVIMQQLHQLSADKYGQELVIQLQLKYYLGNDFLCEWIEDQGWEYLRNLPKISEEFPMEIEIAVAYNLMCGRPVLENMIYSFLPESENWLRLNTKDLDQNSGDGFIHIKGFTVEEINTILDMLPLKTLDHSLMNDLIKGEIATAELKNNRIIQIEVNPEQKVLYIYDEKMRPIPFNVWFDADWRPAIQEQQSLQIESTIVQKDEIKSKFSYSFKSSKGKSI